MVMSARICTGTVSGMTTVRLLAVASMGTTTSALSGGLIASLVRSTVPVPAVMSKPPRACSMLTGDQSAFCGRKRSPLGSTL